MFHSFILLPASDTISEGKISDSEFKLQNYLLKNVFKDITPKWMLTIKLDSFLKEFHFKDNAWNGSPVYYECTLHFTHGYIQQIYVTHWGSLTGNFSPNFVPNSVSDLQIEGCYQEYHLETRHLPREATIVNFSRNVIFGRIDLQNLPQKINVLNLRRNNLSGAVSLQKLPECISSIYLAQNPSLGESVVWCVEIPKGLIRVDFRDTRVQKVRPIFEEKEIRSEVFLVGKIRKRY